MQVQTVAGRERRCGTTAPPPRADRPGGGGLRRPRWPPRRAGPPGLANTARPGEPVGGAPRPRLPAPRPATSEPPVGASSSASPASQLDPSCGAAGCSRSAPTPDLALTRLRMYRRPAGDPGDRDEGAVPPIARPCGEASTLRSSPGHMGRCAGRCARRCLARSDFRAPGPKWARHGPPRHRRRRPAPPTARPPPPGPGRARWAAAAADPEQRRGGGRGVCDKPAPPGRWCCAPPGRDETPTQPGARRAPRMGTHHRPTGGPPCSRRTCRPPPPTPPSPHTLATPPPGAGHPAPGRRRRPPPPHLSPRAHPPSCRCSQRLRAEGARVEGLVDPVPIPPSTPSSRSCRR